MIYDLCVYMQNMDLNIENFNFMGKWDEKNITVSRKEE